MTFTGLIIFVCLRNSFFSVAVCHSKSLFPVINNGKSNNGNPCPKTLDTKTQLQQQTVANAAETINKKCNYFYINSNTRPIQE